MRPVAAERLAAERRAVGRRVAVPREAQVAARRGADVVDGGRRVVVEDVVGAEGL